MKKSYHEIHHEKNILLTHLVHNHRLMLVTGCVSGALVRSRAQQEGCETGEKFGLHLRELRARVHGKGRPPALPASLNGALAMVARGG